MDAKASTTTLTAHTDNNDIHVTAEDKTAWSNKADSTELTAHTGNADIHVTAADKTAWNGKVSYTAVPASATATGTKGDIAYDSGYMYVCTATNTWKRTALTTW